MLATFFIKKSPGYLPGERLRLAIASTALARLSSFVAYAELARLEAFIAS